MRGLLSCAVPSIFMALPDRPRYAFSQFPIVFVVGRSFGSIRRHWRIIWEINSLGLE